ESSLDRHQHDGDGDHRRAENHDQAGRVVRPDEQGQAVPGEAGGAHAVNGDDEIESGENGRETRDKDREPSFNDVGVGARAVGGVESPAGIYAAGQHAVQKKYAGGDVEVPAQQVDAREGEIFGADHDRHQEVAQHGWHDRDQKEEHHDHAMHGEHLVIGIGLHQVTLRSEQFEPDEHGKKTAEEEEDRNRDQIKQRDPLVVGGQQPGLEGVPVVEIVQIRSL